MLLGLGLALLLNPLFLCCLHLLPDFSVQFIFLYSSPASVLVYLCTSGRTVPAPRLRPKVESSSSLSKESTLFWNASTIFGPLSLFLQVNSVARALCKALVFQLRLDGCKHEVMIAANVDTWERPRVCFVDAGLEALGCQDEGYLVVYPPIRGMPGCCPRQRLG